MYFNICIFILQNIIQIWKYLTLTEKCYNHPRSPLLPQVKHAYTSVRERSMLVVQYCFWCDNWNGMDKWSYLAMGMCTGLNPCYVAKNNSATLEQTPPPYQCPYYRSIYMNKYLNVHLSRSFVYYLSGVRVQSKHNELSN